VDLAEWEIEPVQAGDFDESRTRHFDEDGVLVSVTPRRQGAAMVNVIVSGQTVVLDANGFERRFEIDNPAAQQDLQAALSAVRDGGLQETLVVPPGSVYRLCLADGTVMEHQRLFGLWPTWLRRPRRVIIYQAYAD
jgi:hypothetical protein